MLLISRKPKVFRDSAVENLSQFFQRFRLLNVRSNEQLDQLVEQARQIVRGVKPRSLRDNSLLRQQLAGQLSSVQAQIDESGTRVEVTSRYGRVVIRALVTDRVRGKQLFMPMNSSESPVNPSIGSHTDAVTHTRAYKEEHAPGIA